jgi:hypothetical protein
MLIFENTDATEDSDRPVIEFINSIYAQNKFLWALPLIVSKRGCVVNEDYCLFPDWTDPDPEFHFEGVMFGGVNGEAVIGEDSCSKYIDEACTRYLRLHPSDRVKISDILKKRLV